MSDRSATLRKRLDEARRALARAEGERDALRARDAELVREVGLAKGRIALKPKVTRFLEQLQAEAHARSVGRYEELLTAVVSEVLPAAHPIGLELHTERGLPALDVFAARPDGRREDILDGNGGALTNVVSMGLRLIATVKSGKRPFMALDEPDCWTKPERIPSFFRILKESAGRLGVQCLVVSHHDVGLFDGDIAVARLHGRAETGVSIESAPNRRQWASETEVGLRAIRLRNFMSHRESEIHLAPGINALIGDNNLGKSVLMRALRAVCYGECSDADIRHGEKRATVEIDIEGGRTVEWTRELRRNPVNLWRLLNADGSVVEDEGMRYETGGRAVPEWVGQILGIAKLEGLDVQLSHQKFPVFLLGENASRRASVLSIGQESGHIQTMLTRHRENSNQDAAIVRNGERELEQVRSRLMRMEYLDEARGKIETAGALLDQIEGRDRTIAQSETCAARIGQLRARLERQQRRAKIFEALPPANRLTELERAVADTQTKARIADRLQVLHARLARHRSAAAVYAKLPTSAHVDGLVEKVRQSAAGTAMANDIERLQARLKAQKARAKVYAALPSGVPELRSSADLIRTGRRLRDCQITLDRLRGRAAIFEMLPDQPPVLRDNTASTALIAKIEGLQGRKRSLIENRGRLGEEMASCKTELDALLEEIGGECPTCGSNLAHADHLLHADSETKEVAHA